MTQRQMQFFSAVCDCGNVTKAAEQLFVSRPVVSRVLRELEEEIGTTLFIRTTTGIITTEQGNALKKFVDGYCASYNLLIERIRELDTPDGARVLRIGVSPTTVRWFFPNFYYPLKCKHRDMRLLVSEIPAQDTIDAVVNGDVDFAITPRIIDDAYSVDAIKLYDSDVVFCAANTSKYAGMKEVEYQEIENLPMAVPHTGNSTPLVPNPVMFFTQADVLGMAVAGGEVYSVVPREVTEGWKGVSVISLIPRRPYEVYLVWSESLPHKPVFYSLLDFAKGIFDKDG